MVCEPLPGIESEQWIVTMAVGSAGSQWRLCSGGRSWSPDTERAPVSVECFAQVAVTLPCRLLLLLQLLGVLTSW